MELRVNNYYEFALYSNSTLGTNFKNAKLLGSLSYELALKFENVVTLQRQIEGKLPEGTPLEYNKYTYYQFAVNNEVITVADVWIIPNSIRNVDGGSYTIELENVSTTQIATVRDQLRLLGIRFTIK